MICHDFPTYTNPPTVKVFNLIKSFSKNGHKILLVSFRKGKHSERYIKESQIKKYCAFVETVEIPKNLDRRWKRFLYTIKNTLLLPFVADKEIWAVNFMNFYFAPKMKKIIDHVTKNEDIDVILVDLAPMVGYVLHLNKPKILIELQAESLAYFEAYKSIHLFSKEGIKKIFLAFEYCKFRSIENKLNRFDLCITVTDYEKRRLETYLPKLNLCVIPYGVDIEHFKPCHKEEEPNILFFGNLATTVNRIALQYFYRKSLPLIRKEIPDIALYIVGKDPPENVKELGLKDSKIIVTGYVKDTRPYIGESACVILPMEKAIGIKTRLLEAMAMGKAIVATSIATRGIDVMHEKNIIIADNPKEFAEQVIRLLKDQKTRRRIGENARRLVEESYSWDEIAKWNLEAYEVVLK